VASSIDSQGRRCDVRREAICAAAVGSAAMLGNMDAGGADAPRWSWCQTAFLGPAIQDHVPSVGDGNDTGARAGTCRCCCRTRP
jgi:hypothetical protein